jgi:hypothetical protein
MHHHSYQDQVIPLYPDRGSMKSILCRSEPSWLKPLPMPTIWPTIVIFRDDAAPPVLITDKGILASQFETKQNKNTMTG